MQQLQRHIRRVATRAGAQDEVELDEVDPYTGEVIARTARARSAAESVKAGSFTWAYRTAEANEAEASPSKLPVLMLHGIGA